LANIIVDVKEHPEAIIGDFSKPEAAVLHEDRGRLRLFPAQWDVMNKVWRRYFVQPGTDSLPATSSRRPAPPSAFLNSSVSQFLNS